jgi:integrase
MKFDAREAKALQPGAHVTVDGAPGLRLVCSTVGRAWVYRYKSPVDGRMRQIKLGTWPVVPIGQALAEWERLRGLRDEGRDPAQERRTRRQQQAAEADEARQITARGGGPLTVRRLLEDYAALHVAPRRAPKGLRELQRQIATMLGPVENLRPDQVTRSVAYELIHGHAHTPVQASGLRRELGAAWDWAHDSGRLGDEVPNWWRLVLRGKLASRGKIVGGTHQGVAKRVLTADEVGAVLRHLPHVSRLISDLLTLYLWTGCRGAEIVAMEGREVTTEADGVWWTIPRSKLKMARHPLVQDLRVPLIGRAADLVLARKDVHGDLHLFPPQRGKDPHVQQKVAGVGVWHHMPNCTSQPELVRPRWPVSGWAPHDLRRTVRTQLAVMGCPADVAESVLGHLLPGVEGVYNRHQYDAERRAWLMRLDEVWTAAAAQR